MSRASRWPEIRAALAAGDLDRCARRAAAAIASNPSDAEARFLLAMAFVEGGRVAAARDLLAASACLEPHDLEIAAQHARVLLMLREEPAAEAEARRACRLETRSAPAVALDTLGCVLSRLGDHEAALPLFEEAVRRAPRVPEFHFNLAASLSFFGRVAEARRAYEAVLALAPGDGRAWLGITALGEAREDDLPPLEAALASARDPLERLRLGHALARLLQGLGRDAEAFRWLRTVNDEHRARMGFDVERDERLAFVIRRAFERRDFFPGTSSLPDAPIFVTGLPRTGTTLVDRILAAHPDVISAGELQAMPVSLKRLAGTRSRHVIDPETVLASASVSPQELGQAYLARARATRVGQAPRFVDKLPLNFLYIGWIARALPKASILCLRRNPMDSIWSNYRHLFATGSPFYGWSYDLEDTARYWLLFDRLMGFWKTCFPGRILEISYEALVTAPEAEVARILAHCRLPWADSCLAFHENASPVATPSAQQVRQPFFRSAIGQWRKVEAELEPARKLLVAAGVPV